MPCFEYYAHNSVMQIYKCCLCTVFRVNVLYMTLVVRLSKIAIICAIMFMLSFLILCFNLYKSLLDLNMWRFNTKLFEYFSTKNSELTKELDD